MKVKDEIIKSSLKDNTAINSRRIFITVSLNDCVNYSPSYDNQK